MRPAARWITLMALAGAAVGPGLAAVPAFADSAVSGVLASNWYWQEQSTVTPAGAPAGVPAGAPTQTSGVPAGDLGVAYTNQVDKVTALNFDLAGLKAGSAVSSFTVTMPLDTGAHNIASPSGQPTLSACPAIDSFKPGTGPSPFSQVPPQATSVCVAGRYDARHSAYVFDISSAANDWAAGAPRNGVVIQPKPGDNTQFNYAFRGPKDIKVGLVYTPAQPQAAAPAAQAAPGAPAAPAGSSGGGSFAAPPLSAGSAPLPAAPLTSVVAPPLTAPAPQAVPPAAPALAGPAVAPAAASASAPALDALRPNALFWLSLLGLAGLLLLAALVLGDPMAPVAPDPRRRRFAQAVRARTAAAGLPGSRPAGPRTHPA